MIVYCLARRRQPHAGRGRRGGIGLPGRRRDPGDRLPGVRGRLFPSAFHRAGPGVLRASLIYLPALLTLWLLDGIPHV